MLATVSSWLVTAMLYSAKPWGWNWDLTEHGMGIRCQRFSMIVDDGVVSVLNHEPPGEYRVSSAETMLGAALIHKKFVSN